MQGARDGRGNPTPTLLAPTTHLTPLTPHRPTPPPRYALPAVLLALLVASPLNALVAHFLAGFTATEISASLQSAAVTFAIILGLFMPQLSNFLSMQRALTGTLKDALDLYHQRSNEVVVTIQRLEDLGISPSETVRGRG